MRLVRRPLSELHPALLWARTAQLMTSRRVSDLVRRPRFAHVQEAKPLEVEVFTHQSPLRRRLAGLDPRFQETKITNLRLGAAALTGLLIRPGELFSFWHLVGEPSAKRGFLPGLVLHKGQVAIDIGGGLCQMSNLLYWMALHTPLIVQEHHHHGFDAFPDDDRVQPFGSGATVFYNYGDLRLLNPTAGIFQVFVWVTATHLHGSIRCDRELPESYWVEQRGDRFARGADGRVYRDNELWLCRAKRDSGVMLERRLITRNHALVKYQVPEGLIDKAT